MLELNEYKGFRLEVKDSEGMVTVEAIPTESRKNLQKHVAFKACSKTNRTKMLRKCVIMIKNSINEVDKVLAIMKRREERGRA